MPASPHRIGGRRLVVRALVLGFIVFGLLITGVAVFAWIKGAADPLTVQYDGY